MHMQVASTSKRRVLVGAGALFLALAVSGAAWACTALATLDLSPDVGSPEDEIVATAEGYLPNPLRGPLEVRLDGPSGELLATVRPDLLTGRAEFDFRVPDVAPGPHVVIAYETDALGQRSDGTSARAVLEVTE